MHKRIYVMERLAILPMLTDSTKLSKIDSIQFNFNSFIQSKSNSETFSHLTRYVFQLQFSYYFKKIIYPSLITIEKRTVVKRDSAALYSMMIE